MPIYSVEYSVSKREYWIRPWNEMLDYNHDMVLQNKWPDYTLISVAVSAKEAEKVMREHEALLSKKESIVEFTKSSNIYVQMP